MDIQEDLSVAGRYTWEREAWRVGRTLLWRTAQSDDQSVIGTSGSVLCMGKPQDEEVSAVVFQNFQSSFPLQVTVNYGLALTPTDMLDCQGWSTFKGGFVLPDEISRSQVIMGETPQRLSSTRPKRKLALVVTSTGEVVDDENDSRSIGSWKK